VSADGHLSEPGATHGDHTGDLPVVYVQEGGQARATFVTDRFEPQDVLGRAVIVHAKPDNYGNIPASGYTPVGPAAVDLTARTGNAGDRVACGVVGG
jgi:Cu-Zn family superoxide dismutase